MWYNKTYFCQNPGVLIFCTRVNSLLMNMQKFKTTQSLAIKMLFRLHSFIEKINTRDTIQKTKRNNREFVVATSTKKAASPCADEED